MRSVCRLVAGLVCLASVSARAQVVGPWQSYQASPVIFAGSTTSYDAAAGYNAVGGNCGCAAEIGCTTDCGCAAEAGCGVAACTDGCNSCGGGVCAGCHGCGCNGGCCCNSGCNWCNLGDAIVLWDKLHPCCEPVISIGGWVSGGYHDNNTPLSNVPGDGLAFRQSVVPEAERAVAHASSNTG